MEDAVGCKPVEREGSGQNTLAPLPVRQAVFLQARSAAGSSLLFFFFLGLFSLWMASGSHFSATGLLDCFLALFLGSCQDKPGGAGGI